MKNSKKRRKQLAEYGRRGGQSRSAKKIAAVIANGKLHRPKPKSLSEIVEDAAAEFKRDHPEWFQD
jgi:hypothetical protein